ncbi:septum formation initiator family protein [Herbiconiux sp. L3-i23]|uniref:FtsB family cell division protein n=1 Tax=Herbiconiux sp. L3-i23 TaxID=2905871 RepID=UPI002073385F|nr:septum formation initiator family protein [Herbiconiux sp. L3-i23]
MPSKPAKPSAPRKIRVPVALPEESQSQSWLRSIRMSGFAGLVLVILVLFIVVLAPGLRTLLEQRQQIADLQAAVDQQQQNVEDLREQRARWDDPAYIRAQARDRLFYVMPGEYPYLIIDDVPLDAGQGAAPATADLQTTQVDWAASLYSSYLSAGLSDAPPPEEG